MGIKFNTYHFVFFIALLINIQINAQIIDSSKILNHTVKKGETSYGISKKYNIDLNIFFQYNPQAANGINKGQILKIPLVKYDNQSFNSEDLSIDTSVNFHVVRKGETLWSIAKEYGVKVELIKSINNLFENELTLNQKILIPKLFSDTNDLVKPIYKNPNHPLLKSCDTLVIHKVKKRETLYGIASKYNVSIDKIITNNPILSEKGLQKDQFLKVVCRMFDCNEDSVFNFQNELSKINYSKLDEKSLNISVALPFSLDLFDTISKNCQDPSICPLSKMTTNSLKIFNGFHLAFKVLEDQGYNLVINVFDTEYDTTKMKQIIEDSVFRQSHLILGPIFSKNIKLTRTFSRFMRIPMVTYFDLPNKALFKYPNLFKFYTSNATQIKSLAKYFKSKKERFNYIVIGNDQSKRSVGYSKVFANAFNDTLVGIDSSVVFDSITPIYVSRGDNFSKINEQLSFNDTNVIIITDTDVPFMSYIFNKLIELSNSQEFYDYKFMIAGFEELIKMNTIDDIYKSKFCLHFVSKGIIDYNSENVKDFVNSYQKKFNMHPEEVSIKAFDLVMSTFNKVFPVEKSSPIYYGMFNNVNYRKIGPDSGYENKSAKVFRFNNYRLQKIFED